MRQGVAVEANTSVSVIAEELIAGATYELHAAASNSKGEITLASALVVKTEAEEVADATYMLGDNISASAYVLQTNGLRNDYVSFFNEVTSEALYIDFYASLDNGYLPSGTYILGDGSVNTCAQEYTYLALIPNGDLQRFVEGKATVNADAEHDSGYVWYHITAYFTLPNGETVSLDYEGQLIEK
jgi:hypothetical protein